MPNFALEMILKTLGSKHRFDLSSVEWFGVGSEPVSADTLRRFEAVLADHGLRSGALSPCYGLAEATLAVCMSRPGEPYRTTTRRGHTVVGNGAPIGDFEIRIVKRERETSGRVLLRGACVAREAFLDGERVGLLDRDGFLDTKDVGSLEDEELLVLGRADEMFTVAGANHFPYDIEAIARSPRVTASRRAACFCVQDRESGARRLVLLYETRDRSPCELSERSQLLRREVMRQTGLRLDVVVALRRNAIPVTTSGKIQRTLASQLHRSGALADRTLHTLIGA